AGAWQCANLAASGGTCSPPVAATRHGPFAYPSEFMARCMKERIDAARSQPVLPHSDPVSLAWHSDGLADGHVRPAQCDRPTCACQSAWLGNDGDLRRLSGAEPVQG